MNNKAELVNKFVQYYKDIDERISNLNAEMEKTAVMLRDAVALGDLRENAEFAAASMKMEDLNQEIFNIKASKERYEQFFTNVARLDPNSKRVSMGATVLLSSDPIHEIFGSDVYVMIVPQEIASPRDFILSDTAPAVRAILNRVEGDTIEGYTIKEVSYNDICNITI